MKKSVLIAMLLGLQALTVVKLSFFDAAAFFPEDWSRIFYSKGLLVMLNVLALLSFAFLLKQNALERSGTKLIILVSIAVILNIYFGIYQGSYFYANLPLLVQFYEMWRLSKS